MFKALQSVGYLKKHIKKDHSDQAKDIELGDQEQVNVNKVNMWVGNKKKCLLQQGT